MLGQSYIKMVDPNDLRTEPDFQLPFHGLRTHSQSYGSYPSVHQSFGMMQNPAPNLQSLGKEVSQSYARYPPVHQSFDMMQSTAPHLQTFAEEETRPHYDGFFQHPKINGNVPIAVNIDFDSDCQGKWTTLGQTEKVQILKEKGNIRIWDRVTELSGVEISPGVFKGIVIQEGERGGEFQLTQASHEISLNAFTLPEEVLDEDSDDEGRDACDDLQGLLHSLDKLEGKGARITDVTHVVNKWLIQGVVVPMKHHGVIFKMSTNCYLRVHLVRDGLAWKIYETFPQLPGTTCYTKTYCVDTSVSVLREYCAETQPWSWPNNDCEKWAHGAIRATGVEEKLYKTMKVPRLYPRTKDVYKLWNLGHLPGHGHKSANEDRNDD